MKPLSNGNTIEDYHCVGFGRIWRLTGTPRFTAHTVSQRIRHNVKQVPPELWPLGEPPRMRPLSLYSPLCLHKTQPSSLLSPSVLPPTRAAATCLPTRPFASRGKTAPPIPMALIPTALITTPRITNKEESCVLIVAEGVYSSFRLRRLEPCISTVDRTGWKKLCVITVCVSQYSFKARDQTRISLIHRKLLHKLP